ncbi:MAG: acyl-CoA dehydrogenase family protein [Actinomycetota bacterium]
MPGAFQRAYDNLESRFEIPNQSCFTIGLGMVAPTILAHGSDSARDTYLRKMYRGDIVGCPWFSEPGSVRAPGVEIRPLRQMTGGASFNEVFFTEVRVRDDHRLGDVNNGWNVALTTLMNERAAIGAGGGGGGGGFFTRVIEMVKFYGLDRDPVVRDELAKIIIHNKVSGYNNQRALDKIKSGQMPGPEMSMAKLAGTNNMIRLGNFVSMVLGPKLIADSGEWGTYAWNQLILGTPGGRIAGGSDEVMRNIVGERVLGLPKDPGIDSKSPFNELKK